ncbi:MAG: hypothetical protein LBJ11_06415 [Oscillospiraceae bacterium]|jgi:hypothetical protein|nr:hypothetical protein [Oscillospiraceae bacterium]
MNRYEIQTTRNRLTRTVTAEGENDYQALCSVTDVMYDDPNESTIYKPFRCAYFGESETWVYSTAKATHLVRLVRNEEKSEDAE